MRRAILTALAVTLVVVVSPHVVGRAGAGGAPAASLPAPFAPVPSHAAATESASSRRAAVIDAVNEYCVRCHNGRSRMTSLSLREIDLANLAEHGPIWEKVLTRLQLRAMPPVGARRPDEDTYVKMIAEIEAALDAASAADPKPGRPVARRLTRAEYANAVRDLLDLQIDMSKLLPADHAGHGFDNIGEVLSVSPLLMERYLFAADRISRLGVGEPAAPPVQERYSLSGRYMQRERASEDLPFGSRGGLSVTHLFPSDGEYILRLRLHRNDDGYIRGLTEPHLVDFRIDGVSVKRMTIGGEVHARPGPIWTGRQTVEYAGDDAQVKYEFTADEALQARVNVKAGPRAVGITFIKDRVRPTGILKPELVYDDLIHYKGGEPALESVTIDGPYNPEGITDTPSRRRIFSCRPASPAEEEPCAMQILGTLARRAYRRPVAADEVEELRKLYRLGHGNGGFEAGIQTALQGILAGPEFLFRVEAPSAAGGAGPYKVSDLDLASNLSFFLWSSIPDEELLTLAERGALRDPKVLEPQIQRMLNDPRAQALQTNFAGQWLSLRNLEAVERLESRFPDFDHELRDAMRRETELVFDTIVRENRSIVDLLTADFTFVNERLARHYGIPGVTGSRFRRVQLSDTPRRGLLGQASFLTVTSYANRTSPVIRGKWVLHEILDMPPPPPPPDVEALEERSKEDGKPLTMRQALVQHQDKPVCSSCHKLMDPIGFALENFDAVGAFRTTDHTDSPVEPYGVLFDGQKFDDVTGFREALLAHRERFVHTATMKLLTYALGRPLGHSDAPVVRRIMREAAPNGYRWADLVRGVVHSLPFQYRSRTES